MDTDTHTTLAAAVLMLVLVAETAAAVAAIVVLAAAAAAAAAERASLPHTASIVPIVPLLLLAALHSALGSPPVPVVETLPYCHNNPLSGRVKPTSVEYTPSMEQQLEEQPIHC